MNYRDWQIYGEAMMKLLDLVIVDDEPILLKGLLRTYAWDQMGFRVVGTALSGEQAIGVIREKKPDVVLTDIRMKQMTGLQMMDTIRQTGQECLFVVLSAYRDFEYAKEACGLGAFAYLLKPIEDEKLQETMQSAYRTCMERRSKEERMENWENLVKKDATSFLQVIVQKYLLNQISFDKLSEVFETVEHPLQKEDRFIAVNADIDLAYKITNTLEYEAARFALKSFLEENLRARFTFLSLQGEGETQLYLIRTNENATVLVLKHLLEEAKKELKSPMTASISKPYKGLQGIRKSCEEACRLFAMASETSSGSFTIYMENAATYVKDTSAPEEQQIGNALRKNDETALKEAFVRFLYTLPEQEEMQRQRLHSVMLNAEVFLEETYGMSEELKKQFQSYYSNMQNLNASKEVDVSYKILCRAIAERKDYALNHQVKGNREYMSEAMAYIDEHLQEEDLSIVAVAMHVYLNPVYFGRVFKESQQMSFKKYLLQCRMEKAKKLLQDGNDSIGSICEQIGISNPSYFSHLFKEYTGKLPTEYKKEW